MEGAAAGVRGLVREDRSGRAVAARQRQAARGGCKLGPMTTTALRRVAAIVLAAAACLPAQTNADRKDWIQLFNGKNLDGWVPKIHRLRRSA